jgi:hypothetical protein
MTNAALTTRPPEQSLGLRALRVLVASTYVVYIAVSFFRSENFLFALDAVLGVAFIFAITSRAFAERTATRGYLLLLMALYASCVTYAWLALSARSEIESLKAVRNLLYFEAVFIVGLTYVSSRERVNAFIRLVAMLTVLSGLYGLRQAIFGYWGFELERLALMGRSLQEMMILGRARLSASFGDPLLSGVFMMVGLFVIRARWSLGMESTRVRRFYAFGAVLAFLVLVASLTRAPLLGFAVGAVTALIVEFRLNRRSLIRIAMLALGGLAFMGLIIWIFESGWLAHTTNPILQYLDAGVSSVWSLIALFFGGASADDNYFLVSQSKDMRALAWSQGLEFLATNPMGAGFTNSDLFGFALGDTGLLQVALVTGIPGVLTFVAILGMVFLRGWKQARRAKRAADRRILAALLGAWIGFIVTTSISNIATSSVASVLTWLLAAVLVNSKQIFRDPPDAEGAFIKA